MPLVPAPDNLRLQGHPVGELDRIELIWMLVAAAGLLLLVWAVASMALS